MVPPSLSSIRRDASRSSSLKFRNSLYGSRVRIFVPTPLHHTFTHSQANIITSHLSSWSFNLSRPNQPPPSVSLLSSLSLSLLCIKHTHTHTQHSLKQKRTHPSFLYGPLPSATNPPFCTGNTSPSSSSSSEKFINNASPSPALAAFSSSVRNGSGMMGGIVGRWRRREW